MIDAMQVPLRGAVKAVWNVLAYRAGDKDKCWPSLDALALESGFSRKTVCTAIEELERLRLVIRDSPAGGQTTRYIINSEAASQLTVNSLHTKEREEIYPCAAHNHPAAKELRKAVLRNRREGVRGTFLGLCALYDPPVKITVSMIARELGSRPSQVGADMRYLIKHRDIPFDQIDRFGAAKPNPKVIARAKAEIAKAREEGVILFARGSR